MDTLPTAQALFVGVEMKLMAARVWPRVQPPLGNHAGTSTPRKVGGDVAPEWACDVLLYARARCLAERVAVCHQRLHAYRCIMPRPTKTAKLGEERERERERERESESLH
jgi:hypothetical protein